MAKISKIKIQGVTHEIKDNEAYVKPASGIPASDIANGVIPDVSAFITKSVNDLTNYYTKSQTYTQTEVNNLIGAINQFKYEIAASTSAVTSPQSNVLYLIGPAGSGADKYEEYVYTNDWVKIGDTSIDLSGYVTITALNTALASYTTTSDLTTLLSAKVDKVSGKGLSTNDYTTDEKNKLSGIAAGAQVNVIEGVKVNGTEQTITNKKVDISVPTQLSDLSDDATHRVVTDTEKSTWNGKYTMPSGGIPATDIDLPIKKGQGGSNSIQSKQSGIAALANGSSAFGNVSGNSLIYSYGVGSHSEGAARTTSSDYPGYIYANGVGSHAEGYANENTILAEGDGSHAEGYADYIAPIEAKGKGSHVEGYGTSAENFSEHAEGHLNKSNRASTTYGNAGNTQHSVGIGDDNYHRKNAHEIMQNGDHYIYGLGGYDGTNPSSANTLQEVISGKQDTISDLDTIRSGAALGASAVQTETDPTVPAWAKAATKPSYSFSEIEDTIADSQLPDTISSDITGTAMGLKTEKLTEQEFVFRKNPNTIKAKSLTLDRIQGKTRVWNQLIKNGNFANGKTYWGAGVGGVLSVSDRVATVTKTATGTATYATFGQNMNYVIGHKYLVLACVISSNSGTRIRVGIGSSSSSSSITQYTYCPDWTRLTLIGEYNPEVSGSSVVSFRFYNDLDPNQDANGSCKNVMCIDLTLLYGSEIDGMTNDEILAKFEHEYPLPYYETNNGSLINNDAEALETTGFNQWNEEWGNHTWNNYGNKSENPSAIGSNDIIPVLPETEYYIKTPYRLIIQNFTSSGLIRRTIAGNVKYVTPSGTYGIAFNTYINDGITTYDNNICINLYDPDRNGEYEPYRKSALPLNLGSFQVRNAQGSVQTITGGLKSAGSVRDEIVGVKFIKRVGTRAYQSGDESNSAVTTDGTNTNYALATPEEYELVNPLVYTMKAGTTEARISPNEDGLSAPMVADMTYSVADHQDISGKEDKYNKVTSISSSSTDTQYPSAKAVYTGLSGKIDKIVNITWSNLKSLRDSGGLIPGEQYRITDYITTTVQENTQSAGHQFDVIVIADSANKLNENARAILHSGDTYFANSKLEAWELKYCLDNDTTRFAWTDSTNGKGVIYWMKDEWNNECPYDFKNIQFKRYKITECDKSPSLVDQYSVGGINGIVVDTTTTYWCYTFTWIDADYEIEDLTIVGQTLPNDESRYNGVFDNKIESFCSYMLYLDDQSSFTFALSNNCFISTYEYNDGLFDGCYANRLGSNCWYNTFGNNTNFNTFKNNCSRNICGDDCSSNVFGNNCNYNIFGNGFDNNTFENGCNSNTFGNKFNTNTFGNDCSYNIFGNYNSNNTFGNWCNSNTFGNYIQESQFGDAVRYFSITASEMTTAPQVSDTKSYIRWLIVENGVRCVNAYVTTTTSDSLYCQNVRICLGIQGASNNSRKAIDISSCVGSTVNNVYQPANSQTINV